MRILFAGTPRFAAVALEGLIRAGHEIPLVLTQPDRPAGRGLKTVPSDVKQVALAHGIAVAQPASLKDPAVAAAALRQDAAALVVVAYGLILPQHVLDAFPLGCLNIHASLLPRWRGAAPIQRAILAGDPETGVSIMRMDAGLDTGPVYRMESVPIGPDDTAGTLHDRLAALGARLIVEVLSDLSGQALVPTPQDPSRATYAAKIHREEARIRWNRPAVEIERAIRAFNPVPGAFALYNGEALKIWRADVVPGDANVSPGTVLSADAAGIRVACGEGQAVRLKELQRPGSRRLAAADFLRGCPVPVGSRFDDAAG
jgi:methionyl-tRNA formyltransferase